MDGRDFAGVAKGPPLEQPQKVFSRKRLCTFASGVTRHVCACVGGPWLEQKYDTACHLVLRVFANSSAAHE